MHVTHREEARGHVSEDPQLIPICGLVKLAAGFVFQNAPVAPSIISLHPDSSAIAGKLRTDTATDLAFSPALDGSRDIRWRRNPCSRGG